MSSTAVRILAFASLIAAVAASSGWYQAHVNLRELRANELNPIAAMSKEDQELLRTLQTDPYPDKHSAILTAYLAKIRADGVSEHAEMKQRLDRLDIAKRKQWACLCNEAGAANGPAWLFARR